MKIKCFLIAILFFSFARCGLGNTNLITIKILAVNDFHGQISQGKKLDGRSVGGAGILASYIYNAQKNSVSNTIIALIGDQIGASPAASALLEDQPTILFFNLFSNAVCRKNIWDSQCNMVATIGNHEFDRGVDGLKNLISGKKITSKMNWSSYTGAAFPFVSANIVAEKTGKLLFSPYVIKEIKGVKIAFIGAILKNAPSVILAKNIKGLRFLDEAEAINHYIPEVKQKGANIIVVVIHQGGDQTPYQGLTQKPSSEVRGDIVNIVHHLDDAVDVVLSAHTHQFTNAYLLSQHQKPILVTQALSYSQAFANVVLIYDVKHKKLVKKAAQIITTYADQGPGLHPEIQAQRLMQHAEKQIAPITQKIIGSSAQDLKVKTNINGESLLGDFVADALREYFRSDMAIIPIGALRNDIYTGKVTWGDLFSVMPFKNHVVKINLTGQAIYQLLEEQWINQPFPRFLQISGLNYIWNPDRPIGHRVLIAFDQEHHPIKVNQYYTVATFDFLAQGGNNFLAMRTGRLLAEGPFPIPVLIQYIKKISQPFRVSTINRIKKS